MRTIAGKGIAMSHVPKTPSTFALAPSPQVHSIQRVRFPRGELGKGMFLGATLSQALKIESTVKWPFGNWPMPNP